MSQNDLVIANQTFPTTRADINSALQALGSNNSGSSAPTTTYANMLWYDTGTNTLKMRSEANDAWIDLGTLDQSSLSFYPANANVVPVGSVNTFAISSAPTGWLSCNGAAVSRTTYADLFAALGTTYGSGNGSTTFNVPDLRGEFVRGWDDGRGVDSGRGFGSYQATRTNNLYRVHYTYGDATDVYPSEDGTITTALRVGSGVDNVGHRFQMRGGETRPRNIALLYCIKY